MFGLGIGEIGVIFLVGIMVLGPKHLPEATKTLGRTLGMLRRTLDELKHEMVLPPIDQERREQSRAVAPTNTLFEDNKTEEEQPKP